MIAAQPSALQGGAVVTRLLDDGTLAGLRRDALASHATAEEVRVAEPDGETWRGGNPDRWLESAAGGDPLQAFYHSPATLALLSELTGLPWKQSGAAGTYSYYRRAGHHLGLHRDVEECDLAVITCVHDSAGPAAGREGALCLYPGRSAEPLDELRARPDEGAVLVRLEPGQSIVLLGGIVPHRVLPVGERQARIVAPLCYTPRVSA